MLALCTSRTVHWFAISILAGAISGCLSDSDSESNPPSMTDSLQTQTEQGPVEGTLESDGVITFKGLRYAAPPVGSLRFAPPAPPADRGEKLLVADEFGSACVQPNSIFGVAGSSEDCLFLNVYTPEIAGDLPVMVWIHGGGLETGSGGEGANPARLVNEDVVVVTINYRLGLLGFLAHPALSASSSTGESGNYGIMDQQAALAWVQQNIQNFGGNPRNVTLFGESAGAYSVFAHLVAPESAGLFDKAIVQSGSFLSAQSSQSLSAGEAVGDALVATLDCEADVVACLRDLTPEQILAAQATFLASGQVLQAFSETQLLPNPIAERIATGQVHNAPILAGTNLDEYRLYVGLGLLTGVNVTTENYEQRIREKLGLDTLLGSVAAGEAVAAKIAAEYPTSSYETPALALSAIGNDAIFHCTSLDQARALSSHIDTYAYRFSDSNAPRLPEVPSVPGFDFGAAHAFEIPYLLASRESLKALGMTSEQIDLADRMVDYWTNFAKFGDPNPSSGVDPVWPKFSTNSGTFMNLIPSSSNTVSAVLFESDHHCAFWAQF